MTTLGKKIATFLEWIPWMTSWKDPERVWHFQERFGVQRVKLIDAGKGEPFKQIDHDEWKARQKKKEQIQRSRQGHLRTSSDASVFSSSGYSSAADSLDDSGNVLFYRVSNLFWYYLFLLGTKLGDETYYAIFFSFWFWNIDLAVGRRVILVWNLIMYIGQGMKDVVRWPRPSMPPVVQLERKWALEYGMPSTHAMVGLAVPTSILYFTFNRYEYPFFFWALVALTWCILVSTSRIYLGMHSLADIYVGLIFAIILLIPILPFVEAVDSWLLSDPKAPLITIGLSIVAAVLYPGSDRWTPARGDSTVILGTFVGCHLGGWLNFQLGIIKPPTIPPPYPIIWPTYEQYGQTILRMVVGGTILIATKAILKSIVFFIVALILKKDVKTLKAGKPDITNKPKIFAELTVKFWTYLGMGVTTVFLCPYSFRVIGIERATFYTEV